ncbi:MAG: hypothetical protein LBC40_09585 [Dysgonamonadaceae bacterium]|jgi:hypothetical protein|nr:hypothetical protein [Dysgonamonadaceae bacterium]
MKKIVLFFIVLCTAQWISAQEGALDKYRRSSLYTIILDDEGLMDQAKAQIIKETFNATPLPEKFNDHNLDIRSFNPKTIQVTDEEVAAVTGKEVKKKGGFGKALGGLAKSVASDATAGLVDASDTKKLPAIFIKFFEQNKIPHKVVAKWYNLRDTLDTLTNSYFSMDLIQQRGYYDAAAVDQAIASQSKLGLSLLADAGEELINQTFVIGIRFNYVSKEELAKQISAL